MEDANTAFWKFDFGRHQLVGSGQYFVFDRQVGSCRKFCESGRVTENRPVARYLLYFDVCDNKICCYYQIRY